jgi:TRAP-type uncharacterized transport system substrate-binding protein
VASGFVRPWAPWARHWRAAIRTEIDRQFLRTRTGIVLCFVMAVILLSAVFTALRPLPARHLAMATGPPGSAYARAGERYRKILARDGVQLRLVPTNGAVANAGLLGDPRSGISVGFVQAGVSEQPPGNVLSLGTVFYEAVWFFCRCPNDSLFQSSAQPRISIGPPGGADRPLALKLLALNRIGTQRLELAADAPEKAARELLAGELDGIVILTGWDSPVVQQLARAPDITLHQFPRADAYVALEPTLSKVVLPRGVADLANDRPPQDTTLIASKASLAVRADLHPALQYLLLRAAIEVHGRPGMFQRAGEFPAAEEIDLPLSDEARNMYRAGPSFLQRSLPFWLAVLVQRVLILVLPMAGIIYPLWSLVPRLYRWQMQRRIFRIYGDLLMIEGELRRAPADRGLVSRLDALDRRVLGLRLPVAFGEMTYNLRVHIRVLRDRLRASG